jgi:stage II sporulation protein AA (anti-sigma F factor antagonist)
MHISVVEDAGPTAKLTLEGKLDIVGADEIAAPLAVLSKTKSALLLDMAGVTFLTSPGIRQLVTASKALARSGGRLVLLKPNETVVDVLVVAGVSDLMTIVQSEADAAAALQ